MNELALFAGAGGGILGGKLLGWTTVCAVECNTYAASVLVARQNDGLLDPFPIWDDVRTFDGKPWAGRVDVVSGGFPCQDISIIGKAAGITGKSSGLWTHMARIIGEVRPQYVFVENSPLLVQRGLAVVLGDLAALGYDARWAIVGADDAGFPHHRKRFWLVGHASGEGLQGHPRNGKGKKTGQASGGSTCPPGLRLAGWKQVVYSADCDEDGNCPSCGIDFGDCGCIGPTQDEHQYALVDGILYGRPLNWFVEPELGRVVDGMANRVDRLKTIGNGQVPSVAKLAWDLLNDF